nr:hypothetical protein [Methanophagales archaeon]
MQTEVRAGDFKVIAVIDPENKVPEDDKADNIIARTMHVKPTRDFTVLNVTADNVNLSDTDTTNITAEVANLGLRNGTAEVSFVDYEIENCTYKYHFNKRLPHSYLPIPPDACYLGPETPHWIHFTESDDYSSPGVDAIQLHFNQITLLTIGGCNRDL